MYTDNLEYARKAAKTFFYPAKKQRFSTDKNIFFCISLVKSKKYTNFVNHNETIQKTITV